MGFYYAKKTGEVLTIDEIIEKMSLKIKNAKRIDEKLVSLIEYRDALEYLKSGIIMEFV